MKKVMGGWILVAVLTLLTVMLWFFSPKVGPAFGSARFTLASLGELAGLIGLVLFSLNSIFAVRLPFVEKLFFGLPRAYRAHNILGQWAFMLLLAHPLLLLARYAENYRDAAGFLLPGTSLARTLGITALLLLAVALILTLYLRPRYHIWRYTHKILGAALFLGGLHALLIPGFVMQNPLLKGYVLLLAILGVAAFLYRAVLGAPFHRGRHRYAMETVRELSHDVREITLKPLGNPIKFTPGQFVFVSFRQKGLPRESHPFSLSSDAAESFLRITVKRLGDYTDTLFKRLEKGTEAIVEGPYGTFSYHTAHARKQLWIAGGIGITPFLSFIERLTRKRDCEAVLYYCVRNEKEAVHLSWLKKMAAAVPQLRVVPFYSDTRGFLTARLLVRRHPRIHERAIFICAPPAMIRDLRQGLCEAGVPAYNIYSEEFSL